MMIMTAESEYTDSVELILLAMGGGGGGGGHHRDYKPFSGLLRFTLLSIMCTCIIRHFNFLLTLCLLVGFVN